MLTASQPRLSLLLPGPRGPMLTASQPRLSLCLPTRRRRLRSAVPAALLLGLLPSLALAAAGPAPSTGTPIPIVATPSLQNLLSPLQNTPAPPAETAESSSLDLAYTLPPAPLRPVESSVTVTASSSEISLAQLQLAEKQRVLGIVPNFYASYIWDAAPLTPRQKLSLAWHFSTDPVAFLMTAAIAGSEQAQNALPGYHQGTLGYTRRFAATYADGFSSTMLGQALLPSVLHQDPRYFVKPTGSVTSQALYALASTVLCRGDNGRWQTNYSNIGGNLAAAGISDLYYPSSSRRGASLTLSTALLTTASGAFGNLMQQFVLRRMTPNVPDYTTH